MNNLKAKKVYISYSRRGDYSLISKLIATNEKKPFAFFSSFLKHDAATCKEISHKQDKTSDDRIQKWVFAYDENSIAPDNSIRAFMDTLSGADRIIILLSEGYFKSSYCMYELVSLFTKGAKSLLPIVVFVQGYSPDKVNRQKIIEHWKKTKRALPANSTSAAKLYNRFIKLLPLALIWLLGKDDPEFQGLDTLFHVVSDNGNSGITCMKIFKALENPVQLRYRFYSQEFKRNKIRHEMKEAMTDLDCYLDNNNPFPPFQRVHDQLHKNVEAFAHPANKSRVDTTIKQLLELIDTWLKVFPAQTLLVKSVLCIVEIIEKITGLLLIYGFNDRNVLELIIALNRQKNYAHVALRPENPCMYQLLAAALFLKPAKFRWQQIANTPKAILKGKKQLAVLETGINSSENQLINQTSEQKYNSIYTELFDQIYEIENPAATTDDQGHTKMDAMREWCSSAVYYLPLNGDLLQSEPDEGKFRKDLGDNLPKLTQIITRSDFKDTMDDYLIDGLTSGGLFVKIDTIYAHTKKLKKPAHENT